MCVLVFYCFLWALACLCLLLFVFCLVLFVVDGACLFSLVFVSIALYVVCFLCGCYYMFTAAATSTATAAATA